jgi:hypothetical protein
VELEETFTRTIFTFGAGDYPQGCEVHYGGNYGVATFVKNCGRVDGTYSAWTWGDNELRFNGRGGQRRLYFFHRPNGQYFIRDDKGNFAEIASIRR